MRWLITGGAGFIGSNFVRYVVKNNYEDEILVLDKLTYAGRESNLEPMLSEGRVKLSIGDIADEAFVENIMSSFEPDIIVHFAAETHVDRSLVHPEIFVKTNIIGSFNLVNAIRKLDINVKKVIHISTDEVYGSSHGKEFTEEDPLNPSNPYSATKAAADILVRVISKTYGIPLIVLRPSNNYGPYQYPEKLIPKTIIRALLDMPIPIHGTGLQKRDWLYVEDFCEAIMVCIDKGRDYEVYNVPGFCEKSVIEVVEKILEILGKPHTLIRHVEDRPHQDTSYKMSGEKILKLGWKPKVSFDEGIRKTVEWYVGNKWWWEHLISDSFFLKEIPWKS